VLVVACILLIVYRPPPPATCAFYEEFVKVLNKLSPSSAERPVVVGDFNLHLEEQTCLQASKFIDILDVMNLRQHIKTRTHNLGGCLDLVLTPPQKRLLKLKVYEPNEISDHSFLQFDVSTTTSQVRASYCSLTSGKVKIRILFYCTLTDMRMLWVNVLLHKNQPNTVHMQLCIMQLHYSANVQNRQHLFIN